MGNSKKSNISNNVSNNNIISMKKINMDGHCTANKMQYLHVLAAYYLSSPTTPFLLFFFN